MRYAIAAFDGTPKGWSCAIQKSSSALGGGGGVHAPERAFASQHGPPAMPRSARGLYELFMEALKVDSVRRPRVALLLERPV